MKNEFSVGKIVEICKGKLFCGEKDVLCKNFVRDTREMKKGDTYIGLLGKNHDGSSFYQEAFDKGANAVILSEEYVNKYVIEKRDKPIILVQNPNESLKELAAYKRKTLRTQFVAITGSVGKTSTRDIIYSVLKERYETLKGEKNYNNAIGVPLTMLKIEKEDVAVIEMGMNHLGEIAELSNIVKPHIGVITNIGTAHIGNLGSRENILKAKLEILEGMDEDGFLIINNDNDLLHAYYQKEKSKREIITIGIHENSDFMAKNIILQEDSTKFTISHQGKDYEVEVPIPGTAFIYNALVGIAVGVTLNMDMNTIIDGIQKVAITQKRLEIIKKDKYTMINDSYNASEDSMKASLEVLKNRTEKRKIAVLGDMLELGEFSKKIHMEVGKKVVQEGIDLLVTVGEEARFIALSAKENGMKQNQVYSFHENKEVLYFLKKELKKGDAILFKASNRLNLSEIVEKL